MVTTRSKSRPVLPPDGRGSDGKDGDKVKASGGGRQVGMSYLNTAGALLFILLTYTAVFPSLGAILKHSKKKQPRRKNHTPQSSPLLNLPLEIWNQVAPCLRSVANDD